MRAILVPLLVILSASAALAQDPPPPDTRETNYPFIVVDSPPHLFTMRQLDQDYLSAYRLFAATTNEHLRPAVSYLVQGGSCLLLLKTMTHEEGHRTILTREGIHSHARSFLFMERAGYVDGVTDQTLKTLRDTKFPTFVRLHTAGFESDYMLATREETLMSFGDESYRNLAVEYLFRKAALLIYFTEGMYERDTDGPEEADELKRDIVGNDLYGVIRHLHRPTMQYYRYTRYADLTGEERQYLQRVQSRTFLNLANPNLIGIRSFRLGADVRVNLGLGHCMGPFGDFIDEKFWLAHGRKLKVTAYLREFQNRSHWFFGAGAAIVDYPVAGRVSVTAMAHWWNQPVDLSFNSSAGRSGGALDLSGSYRFLVTRKSRVKYVAVDLGMICKTSGFLPEEVVLDRHVGFRAGVSFGL